LQKELLDIVERSLAAGKIGEAIKACRELNIRYPEYFDGWRIAGEVHARTGKAEAVLFSTEKADELRPGDPNIQLQRIEAFLGLDDLEMARSLMLDFDNSQVTEAGIHDRLGRHLASLDLHDEALDHYEAALAIDPGNASLLFNRATAERFLGLTDKAVETLDEVLRIDDGDYEAQAMRSSLKSQTVESNHIKELEALLSRPDIDEAAETSLCYALAKEYDDIDDPVASFSSLKRGADIRRSGMNYSVDSDINLLEEIKSTYDADYFRRTPNGFANQEAIFIVGLPRTGTTLAERILSSHSEVYAAGELDNFGRQMMNMVAVRQDTASDKLALVRECADIDASGLGRAYIDSTRPMTADRPRFIDKLPFNYLYLGLIHRALPGARIINLVRHPMATCYAVYKQLFRDPYPFSYDLKDLGRYFVAYSDLMAHWNAVMPGVIHTVHYEDVVDDLEGQARKLVDFCNLSWEENCVMFHKNKQASTTARAAQVRSPIYRSSLNRWQRYRGDLRVAEQVLLDAGIDTSTREQR
jgi:tetratricopeptide (TPR) repeat protein